MYYYSKHGCINTQKPIFIQRQGAIPNPVAIEGRLKRIYQCFFTAPTVEKNEEIPPFTPLIFVSNEIPGITQRLFGASADNSFEKGAMAINVTLVVTPEILKRFKNTLFKELLSKGLNFLEDGEHFTLNSLNFENLFLEDVRLFVENTILAEGSTDDDSSLEISHVGKDVSKLIQNYLRDKRLKDDLEAVWDFLEKQGRRGEKISNTMSWSPEAR